MIFLVDGFYTVSVISCARSANAELKLRTNTTSGQGYVLKMVSSGDINSLTYEKYYKKGDYIHSGVTNTISRDTDYFTQLHIKKIG